MKSLVPFSLLVSFLFQYHYSHFIIYKQAIESRKRSIKYYFGNQKFHIWGSPSPLYLTAVCSWRSHLISLGLIFLTFKIRIKIRYHTVLWRLNYREDLETERESRYVTISGLNWTSGLTLAFSDFEPLVQWFCNNYSVEKVIWWCIFST